MGRGPLGIREIYSKGSANIHYGMTKQQLLNSYRFLLYVFSQLPEPASLSCGSLREILLIFRGGLTLEDAGKR